MSPVYDLGVRDVLGRKNHVRRLGIIQKSHWEFVHFSFMNFWTQNILKPPDQDLSKSLDHTVSILLVSNIHNGIIQI